MPQLSDDVGQRLAHMLGLFERDHWAGGTVLRGEFPRVPTVAALPTASSVYAYRKVVLLGDGSTTPDVEYTCLRSSLGVWDWRVAATG